MKTHQFSFDNLSKTGAIVRRHFFASTALDQRGRALFIHRATNNVRNMFRSPTPVQIIIQRRDGRHLRRQFRLL